MAKLEPLSEGLTYVNIVGGKLATKTNEGEGTERTKKDGSKTWENYHKNIKGKITSIKMRDTDFGQQLSVIIDNEITLNMAFDSKYATSILTKLRNINFEKELTLSSYDFEDKDGKRHIGLSLIQDGHKIESNWDEVPQLEEKKKAGKVTWDNTNRVNYFADLLNNFKIDSKKTEEESGDMLF